MRTSIPVPPTGRPLRVAVVATHPVQYQVPWLRGLARASGIELRVFYALLPDARQQGVGFGVAFEWDVPLLDGYEWEVLPNRARRPGLDSFFGTSTPGIGDALRSFRPDVAIITGWQKRSQLQALWACMRLDIPRIVRGESNGMRARPAWVRALHRALLGRFHAFLAIGRASRDFYLGYGIPPEHIFLAPYFVENGRFASQAAELEPHRAGLRQAWGIPAESVCFLYAGKLEPKKRILDLLHALAAARARHPHLHLLVVGHGVLMREARALVASRGLPVTFAGFLNQTEMARAYAAADCLVLPSDYGETWGLVVNEAMACGLPVVVSDRVGCGPDLVSEGSTGGVFPFGDVEALADRLADLAADPAGLALQGARARERVTAYSVEAAVRGTLQAIGDVAVERSGRLPVQAEPVRREAA